MHLISESITLIFLFIALYFEVFLLITYFEFSYSAPQSGAPRGNSQFLSVSIIVPVWNEEKTLLKTIFSLLNLDYPRDKLSILIVDDGSTDNTQGVLNRFKNSKQVQLLKKENGGKHTALNYALQFVESDLVGCLDADSFVHPKTLKRIVSRFEDKEMMAVTPSVIVFEPKGILQLIQKAEYMFGIFLRKIFSHLNAIYITPGPFSIFRRSVFDKIGNYRHAHSTEDLEMALRMQKNKMKIGNVHNAFVYTIAPSNLKSLYKQRLRWTYGFLKNALDYREMFFKPQYGHLGVVVLPAAGFSIFSSIYFFGASIFNSLHSIWQEISRILSTGFYFPKFNFDFFYFNTDIVVFVSIMAVLGTFFIIITSRKLAEEESKFGVDSVLFLLLYMVIAPFWMTKALYNVVLRKDIRWR